MERMDNTCICKISVNKADERMIVEDHKIKKLAPWMNQRVNVFKHSSSYLTTFFFFFIAGVDNYKRNYLDNFSFLLQLLWHSAWFNIK